MKYHQFVPDPDRLSARIAGHDAASGPESLRPVAAAHGAVSSGLPTTLAGITALRDRAFVDAAYRLLLGRDPDPDGREQFVGALRAGSLDKVEILGTLRFSPEGRQRAITIEGLEWRYQLRRLARLPVAGAAFRWVDAVLRLPSLVRLVQRQQAALELASIEAGEHVAAIQRIQGELRELRRLSAEMSGDTRELFARTDAAQGELRALHDDMRAVERSFEARHQRLTAANTRLAGLLDAGVSAAARPDEAERAGPGAMAERRGHTAVEPGLPPEEFDRFYLEFEDRFRGSREDTKRVLEVYVQYVSVAGAGTASSPILDVGCGRGEWLELLRERGYVARGVDQNRIMIAENRDRGLEVADGDVLAHLAGLPDRSVGMVTGFHIIEHLPFALLVRLVDECRRVLQPGGCAIFETPNPENLVVSGYTFYLDPTHRHPLPPQMTEFLAWQRGFSDVEVVRLHPRPETGTDQAVLDRWFRSATDYAVIAWKDRKGSPPA